MCTGSPESVGTSGDERDRQTGHCVDHGATRTMVMEPHLGSISRSNDEATPLTHTCRCIQLGRSWRCWGIGCGRRRSSWYHHRHQLAKPTSITLTCADGGVSVNKITWSSWHPDQAVGKGVLSWNTCLPQNCAAGIGLTYPVTIKLGGLAHAPESLVFSKMTLGFPQGGPAGLDNGTYILDSANR